MGFDEDVVQIALQNIEVPDVSTAAEWIADN